MSASIRKLPAKKKLLIVGASGHGLVAKDAAEAQGYRFVGYLDSYKPVGSDGVIGHPDKLGAIAIDTGAKHIFVAISNNYIRSQVTKQLLVDHSVAKLISIIHPAATVAPDAILGAGSLVCAGAVVNSGCIISQGCIINTKASIDHGGKMEEFSSLLPGCTVCGDCRIGVCTCVCAGVCVSHGISVGDHTLIGAGSLILKNVPSYSLVYGSPAKFIKKRSKNTKHF
jgi:sugar O-acyltransferase (sialic acid O-acetyltransferase NeuD family)